VQILVLVATIQTRLSFAFCKAIDALKTVVEKVSLNLANTQGLVGPKSYAKAILNDEREAG